MKERLINFDDTDLALVGLTLLAAASLFVVEDPNSVVTVAIAAIAGLARGRKQNGNGEG